MKELARGGRGTFESIGSIRDVQSKTSALLERTERAVMTDVALEWDGPAPISATPDPVPDLYAGRPLFVTARFDPSKPLPKLRARLPAEVAQRIDAEAARRVDEAVEWARAQAFPDASELSRASVGMEPR